MIYLQKHQTKLKILFKLIRRVASKKSYIFPLKIIFKKTFYRICGICIISDF